MPVIVKPSPEKAGKSSDGIILSSEELLRVTSTAWAPSRPVINFHTGEVSKPESRSIMASSFFDLDKSASDGSRFTSHDNTSTLIPYRNGFVDGVIRAFEQDLHLVLRPDDVWLSILTQFSMFVNSSAEAVRGLFVAHKGKIYHTIDISPHPISLLDKGDFAQHMIRLIEMDLVDRGLTDWIMPNFTTTTDNDKSVAAIVMMGTLQKYMGYGLRGGCGFPSVTLLGERSDWEEILRRVEKLPSYGAQPTEWSKLLVPVIKHMIESFYRPDSQEIKDFWLRACHSAGAGGSQDPETLSGWIASFCFWSKTGEYLTLSNPNIYHKKLKLDGVEYPFIRRDRIPEGIVSVPVTLVEDAQVYKSTLVAGSVGMTARTVGNLMNQTAVQPRSGWWMLKDLVALRGKEAKQAAFHITQQQPQRLPFIHYPPHKLPLNKHSVQSARARPLPKSNSSVYCKEPLNAVQT
jgi:uncharacterized protein DUF4419